MNIYSDLRGQSISFSRNTLKMGVIQYSGNGLPPFSIFFLFFPPTFENGLRKKFLEIIKDSFINNELSIAR